MAQETILVVDDEANIVELARLYLEKEGFQVEVDRDGAQALAKNKWRSCGRSVPDSPFKVLVS